MRKYRKEKQFYEGKIQAVKNMKLESSIKNTVNNFPRQIHSRHF
jgi:hypothetical protein